MKLFIATLLIVFGVLELLRLLPFPYINLSLISAGTPKLVNMVVVFVLPLLIIVSGVTALFKYRAALALLLGVLVLYLLVCILGVSKLVIWDYIFSDLNVTLGRTALINIGNLLFYLAAIAIIFFCLFPPNKSLNQDAH